LTKKEIGENKIEYDQKHAKYAGQNSLSFTQIISRKNDREKEKVKKGKLVMNQKSDGQNTDKNKDDQSQLKALEEEGLEPSHHNYPLKIPRFKSLFLPPFWSKRTLINKLNLKA